MKKSAFHLLFWALLVLLPLQSGCIGFGIPSIFQMKPYTLLSEGDELGRDQLANRFMVANHMIPLKGFSSNSVLTALGQPQDIDVIERDVSEDWYFIYYKTYKKLPMTGEGVFMVRIYENQVIDVVKVT